MEPARPRTCAMMSPRRRFLRTVGRTKNKQASMPEKNVVPIVGEAANSPAAVTPDSYANEPIRFAP
jgi:hypothetical protein